VPYGLLGVVRPDVPVGADRVGHVRRTASVMAAP
jgi:hypothetical protein